MRNFIRRGDAARDAGDWAGAALHYRSALDDDPHLAHVWIQLAHVLAHDRQWSASRQAYDRALREGGDHADVLLHLGHLGKRAGWAEDSAASYRAAAELGSHDALEEIVHQANRLRPVGRDLIRRAIAFLPRDGAAAPDDREGQSKVRIVYDISDLVAHFRHHRLPTGIQRVQLEVVGRALEDPSCTTRICCFINGRDELIEVPAALFVELARLAIEAADTEQDGWVDAVSGLVIHLAMAPPLTFHDGECLINLGTSWWIYNYALLIRNAKATHSISYICFVHDLIPVYAAEHVVRGVQEDYVGWLTGVFDVADHFIANSQSTARDLLRAGRLLGHDIGDDKVSIVRLDADFRQPLDRLDAAALAVWDLDEGPYVLLVSTIESRKNHVLALNAWAQLLRDDRVATVPRLVMVGRTGWLNNHVFELLADDPLLAQYVTHIERVSDDELALLYRESLFTIYPGHYEGWGLPITESLSYGKLPIVADNSSLPEAGGRFASLFESNSVPAFVAALERAINDAAWRREREAEIRDYYAPRAWAEIAEQIVGIAKTIAMQPRRDWRPHLAAPRLYYPLVFEKNVRIWRGLRNGEMFRIGTGWHWPDENGSRTLPQGGCLQFGVPQGERPWLMYVKLHGLDEEDCPYTVTSDQQVLISGSLEAGATRWSPGFRLPPPVRGVATVCVRGDVAVPTAMSEGGGIKVKPASIGVVGFFLCLDADDEREHLVAAEVLGQLDDINAYREPAAV